jgi:DNA polymerase III subunit epsilon
MMKRNTVMVFDVETTGLIPKRGPKTIFTDDVSLSPYILQLSFIVYDMNTSEVIKTFNSYIDIDDTIEISPKITELTGIVRETCQTLGKTMEYVLTEFYKEYVSCDVVVAHNIDFDKEMIMIEVIRNYSKMVDNGCLNPSLLFNDVYNFVNNIESYCTMRNGKELCNLWTERKTTEALQSTTRRYKKNPKLSELYFKIFNEVPVGLHDALVDTDACLKCYIYLMSLTTN